MARNVQGSLSHICASRKKTSPHAYKKAAPDGTAFISYEAVQKLRGLGALLLRCIDNDRHSCVTGDIKRSTEHIEHTVDTCNECETFEWEACNLQNHCEHDESAARNTCGSDGAKRSDIMEYLAGTLPSRNTPEQNLVLLKNIMNEMKNENKISTDGRLWYTESQIFG